MLALDVVNMKTYTFKDSDVEVINDGTKATDYRDNKTRILRIFYKPKLAKSKILIEISSYYYVDRSGKDEFECEINVSENKNDWTDRRGGKRIAIRRVRFEGGKGGGARSGGFFPSAVFNNNNNKEKYFHFNVKKQHGNDWLRLGRGKNNGSFKHEGLVKITEIRED